MGFLVATFPSALVSVDAAGRLGLRETVSSSGNAT
jgi:hypothetical protein